MSELSELSNGYRYALENDYWNGIRAAEIALRICRALDEQEEIIAAAPDLLEACKWLENVMDHDAGHAWCAVREQEGANEWIKSFKAAIASAEGK